MSREDICTEAEIRVLVHSFYARIRADDLLGPIFDSHIVNWDHHLAKLIDFWSSTLRGTARFRGTPMQTHAKIPDLSAELFQHWFDLFKKTTAQLNNPALQAQANKLAERIAQSLWYGYQINGGVELAQITELDVGKL